MSAWYIIYHVVGFLFEDQAEIRKCWLGNKYGKNKDLKVMMELETNQKWILEDESIPHKSPKPRQDGMGSWAWQFAKGQANWEQNECFKLHYNMMTLVGFFLNRPSVKSLNNFNCESPPNGFFWYSQLLFLGLKLHILRLGRFKISRQALFLSVLETNVPSKC